MGLDTESDQRADGEPEGYRKEDVTDADHGGGSGLVEDVSVRHCLAVSRGDGLGLWAFPRCALRAVNDHAAITPRVQRGGGVIN